MRITTESTSAELAELRDSFKPRWKAEAARLKSMRATYAEGTDERDRAEQRYADFETVATAVIVIDDLRRELEAVRAEKTDPAPDHAGGSSTGIITGARAAAARLKSMRATYAEGTDERDQAEQRHADFETVAAAVVVIDDLRRELEAVRAEKTNPAPAADPVAPTPELAHIRDHLARGLGIHKAWTESPEIANRPFGDSIAVPAIDDAWVALDALNDILD